MDIIIEDTVLFRDRKKWLKRLCKLVRTNNFSDSVKLLVYNAEDSKIKRAAKTCAPLLSKHVIYGHLHGVNMGSQSHVMYIVCKNTVECLAFEDFDSMKLWSDLLGQHLNDISQFVDLVYADKHSLLKGRLEGRLFFNCSHISFIRSPSSCEPKLLMSWKIADVMEYGCRNADKKNSVKWKSKNTFTDDSQSLFIMKVSPTYLRAPNTHIFSCKDPIQFCNWMENLASNQENVVSPSGCAVMSQRWRMESFNTWQRSNTNTSESSVGYDQSYDSKGLKTLRFFPETSFQSRTPRFQRSSSEIRPSRVHVNSQDVIQEKEELELNELNVAMMCQSETRNTSSNTPQSPQRCSTLTCLERYPFEKERGRPAQSFRRQMSEGAPTCRRQTGTSADQIEFSLPRPKSSNNYCSILNLHPGKDSAAPPSSSTSYQPLVSVSPDRGAHSPQSVNMTDNILDYQCHSYSPPSSYINVEFTELIHEISEYCKTDNGALRYADLIFEHCPPYRPIVLDRKYANNNTNNNSDAVRYVKIDLRGTMVLRTIVEPRLFANNLPLKKCPRRCICL